MTHFEYISVAVAIVLSLAVVRLLDAIPHITTPGRRYWVHAVWVAFLLLWSAIFWWLSWSYSARREEFEFGPFLLIVTPPGLLYLAAATLVSHAPFEIDSWSDHFWRVRKKFFAYLLGFLLSLVFTSFVLQALPLLHPLRALQLLLAAIFIAGFATPSPRVHMFLAGLLSVSALAATVLAIAGILRFDLRAG